MPKIPEPEYIHEIIEGSVYELPEATTLVVGQATADLASYAPRIAGTVVLRYGLSLQTPSTNAIIPGLFVSEKGVALVGREAWDFMLAHFQLYPRADVVGFRVSNGAPLQVFLRELDFGTPIRVFAYESVDISLPPAEITQVRFGDAAAELPELLTKYIDHKY
ncbi:MAG: hypothetical protein KF716_16115 [Anaerolineae bacterium]|nr:hypothetical protein [Anaerolineae bacterium]